MVLKTPPKSEIYAWLKFDRLRPFLIDQACEFDILKLCRNCEINKDQSLLDQDPLINKKPIEIDQGCAKTSQIARFCSKWLQTLTKH